MRSEWWNLDTIFGMSPLELIVIVLGVVAILVVWMAWRSAHPDKAEGWPVTEGTIQSVGTVIVHSGRSSHSVEVGDFSYRVNNEYYSGRLTISGDRSSRSLVNQKIQVHYNPEKPEEYSLPQMEIEGFVLDRYNESFGEDIDPIDLNIDKI
jgi:hypothetical protein